MTANDILIADEAPWSDEINAYDEAQLKLYLRLLDATVDDAPEGEICKILFGIDAAKEPARARRCLESHLKRARWMTERGYLGLVRGTQTVPDAAKSSAKH